jgi:peptidoglycan hydrolase-like amidase
MPVRSRIRAGGVVTVVAAIASLISLAPSGSAAAACPSSAGRAIANAPDPVPRAQVVFRGHGSGHGLGMSQYGAQGAARLGCSYPTILATYYRGTHVATAPMPRTVTVRMTENARWASVDSLTGSVTWRTGGRTVHVQRDGRVRVHRLSATSAELLTGTRRVWAGRVFGGVLRAIHRGGIVRLDSGTDPYVKLPMRLRRDWIEFRVDASGMDAVKVFVNNRGGRAMDKYLLGLAEVPSSWPQAALRAQVVAARTFAVKRGGAMLPTVAHQNWDGYDQEAAAGAVWSNAVSSTSGRIIVDGSGRAIDALYSASMAGFTEDKVYSWGGTPFSYLRAVNDARWTRASDNPASTRAWTVGSSRRRVAGALGFSRVTNVFVFPRGDPRRVRGVRVIGVRGGHNVTEWIPGFTVRNALGLPSPGFVVKNNS